MKERFERKRTRREKISRRRFLKIITLGVLSLIIYELIKRKKGEKEPIKEEKYLEKTLKNINKFLVKIENNDKRERFEEEFIEYLKNKAISYPLEAYIMDDSELALDTLWEEKNDFLEKRNLEELIKRFREIKLKKLESLETSKRGYVNNFKIFRLYVNNCISEVFLTFNWDKIFQDERYRYNKEQTELFEQIISDQDFLKILSNTLIAIILTEICYIDEEAEKNLKLLEFLLNKHGLLFIVNIPSLYDERLSLGPFQLTDLVVNPDKEKFYPINFMNQFIKEFPEEIKKEYNLPQYKIPEKLEDFGIRDHFKGEILLLLYYLLELFKNFNLNLLKDALKKKDWFYYQVSYYLAGCHHLPGKTKKLFEEFLNKDNINQEKGFVDFVNYKGEGLSTYLDRFRNNLKEVSKY